MGYFHPAYFVRTIEEVFRSVEIKLPFDTVSTISSTVLPAFKLVDLLWFETPTFSAVKSKSKAEAARLNLKLRGQNTHVTLDTPPVNEYDDTAATNAYFQSQIIAPSFIERAVRQCSNCRLPGHNATLFKTSKK